VVVRVAANRISRVQVETEPVVVAGDQDRLGRVLANLLQNALRYASVAPGAVQVTLEHAPAEARLVVGDVGPGLPPEALERVFDRFYRIDRSRSRAQGGTGLGARDRATHHGGSRRSGLGRESPGGGARFCLRLPAERSWLGDGSDSTAASLGLPEVA
jgi:signal transduction histidine kinase